LFYSREYKALIDKQEDIETSVDEEYDQEFDPIT